MLDHPDEQAIPPEILRAAAPIAFDPNADGDDIREAIGHIVINARTFAPWQNLSASEIADAVLQLARAEGLSKPLTSFDSGKERGLWSVLVKALQRADDGEDDGSPEQERTPPKRRDQEREL